LKKICNVGRDDCDLRVPVFLWAYRKVRKQMIGKRPFRLVYGKELVMKMDFILPSLHVAVITNISVSSVVEEILSQLV
jgi:hypothetical protein